MGRYKEGVSLKSRGKEPLTRLNREMMAILKEAPRKFFVHRFRDWLAGKLPGAPTDLLDALVKHIMDGANGEFTWDNGDGGDQTIHLDLSAAELDPLLEETQKFMREELPNLVPGMVRSAADAILTSLKDDWQAQRAYEQARSSQFRANLEALWGDAFDTLRMIYTIAVELGDQSLKRRKRSRSKKDLTLRDVLAHLHARACQIVMEIITLIENGLADGAMARWRTLHEITIVAELLVQHGEELAVRYRAHEAIEAKRAMDRFVLNHEALGYVPPTQKELRDVEKNYRRSLDLYGENFGSEYGWAAKHLKIKKPRLVDLEVAAGLGPMQSYYRMASYNVHATSKGIAFRLGRLDDTGSPIALAGASNVGFVEPAQHAAADLVHITILLANGTTRFDRMIEWSILAKLKEELPGKLVKAQRVIERAHRKSVRIG